MRTPDTCARLICLTLTAALAPGCMHNPPTVMPAPVPSNARSTTHVYVGKCVFAQAPVPPDLKTAEFSGALLGAILPRLISQVFNRFGAALDVAGKEHTWQATGFTNVEITSRMAPCIQIVRGAFFSLAPQKAPEWGRGTKYFSYAARLRDAGIYLAAKPQFFFEGRFRASSDPSVMAIVPVAAGFEEAIGQRALRNEPARFVTLTLAFHPPGKAATDAQNPSTSLVLGRMTPQTWFEFEPIPDPPEASAATSTIPEVTGGQPSTTARKEFVPTAAAAGESLWFKLPLGETPVQLSVTAAVTEVQGANEFLTFLSDVFKGSRDELEKLTKIALIESEREKARLAEVQAANEASVAYDKAATAALVALAACSADGAIEKAGDARVKQQSANLLAEKAGRPRPFAALVPLSATPADVVQACGTALKSFQ